MFISRHTLSTRLTQPVTGLRGPRRAERERGLEDVVDSLAAEGAEPDWKPNATWAKGEENHHGAKGARGGSSRRCSSHSRKNTKVTPRDGWSTKGTRSCDFAGVCHHCNITLYLPVLTSDSLSVTRLFCSNVRKVGDTLNPENINYLMKLSFQTITCLTLVDLYGVFFSFQPCLVEME